MSASPIHGHCPGRRVAPSDLISRATRGDTHAERSTAEGDGRRVVPQVHQRRRVGHRLDVGPRDPAHRREDIVEVLQHVAICVGLPCGHGDHGRARDPRATGRCPPAKTERVARDETSQTVFAYLSGIRTGLRQHDWPTQQLRHTHSRGSSGASTFGGHRADGHSGRPTDRRAERPCAHPPKVARRTRSQLPWHSRVSSASS